MKSIHYPSLYQINTRVWLNKLAKEFGRQVSLDGIPEYEFDKLSECGFHWIWLLSVWQTGLKGQNVSRTHYEWLHEFKDTLSDLKEEDIGGSGFAITNYSVHKNLGGEEALIDFREKLKSRGMKLMLDFVPNHTAIDNPWVDEHPDYFVQGSETMLEQAPMNFVRVNSKQDNLILAHGRDPYFQGWPDTLQLNYGNPETQEAMISELSKIARLCDGVRCDMAMLVLPEVFQKTWGVQTQAFWPRAIKQAREVNPDFTFMAEVYWDMEWTMQQQGFDYAYDKRLYDRLRERNTKTVRQHFYAGLDYQNKLARFLENHDEPRAAATFPDDIHKAAAIVTYLSPGLRFFHQGQIEGKEKRLSPHLVRSPEEKTNQEIKKFYKKLLSILSHDIVSKANWHLLKCQPAWDGNSSYESFIIFSWHLSRNNMLICVNYSDYQSQCYIKLPFDELKNERWLLKDLMNDIGYERDGNDLTDQGHYLDLLPWQYHVFELIKI